MGSAYKSSYYVKLRQTKFAWSICTLCIPVLLCLWVRPIHVLCNRNDHAIRLFIDANILPIFLLYFKSVSYLMHDIHINTSPSQIVNFFQKTSSIHA